MARLTREQSQALTREKLLDSAYEVVARDGYSGATVERIAEEAGFSKGAFYSNFASKEEILLRLLARNAGGDIVELTGLLEGCDEPEALIDTLAKWVNNRARDQRWGMLAIEHLRIARRDDSSGERHLKPFQDQWEALGRILIRKLFPDGTAPASAFYIGGMVFELTYGGIVSFMKPDAPGEMVRVALRSMFLAQRVKRETTRGRNANLSINSVSG